MNVQWKGNLAEIGAGLRSVSKALGLVETKDGMEISLEQGGEGLVVSVRDRTAKIKYSGRPQLFRALSHLAAHASESDFELNETPCFEMLGAMIDSSRNAVPKLETIRTLLRNMAIMGYNTLMIYMEDTYEVSGHPYFGHMRGRYTATELKQIDDEAYELGIEVIPCIQTLAHLPRFLQWRQYMDVRDNPEILLVGDERTYALIEDMIRAASSPFRSKKIHLGMDEAHEIGLGVYLKKHGPRDRFEILNEHLERVGSIARKFELKPIIWSDMFFRLVDPSGDYAAEHIPEEAAQRIPSDVQLVYWDYFNTEKEFYLRKIDQHEKMKKGTMFAGGVWTWNGFAVSYNKTFLTTLPAIDACKKKGIKDVVFTLWGDDGGETHLFQALFGLQLGAELSYGLSGDSLETVNLEQVKRRFRESTGGNPDAFLALDLVDNVKALTKNERGFNTSKQAFYQDPLVGLFDKHLEGLDLQTHFANLANLFRAYAAEKNALAYLFEPIADYCGVLVEKVDVGLNLKSSYDRGDRKALRRQIAVLKKIDARLASFHRRFREIWLRDFKPFGLEVIDIRLGGLTARVKHSIEQVAAFVEGRVVEIPELAADRLFHDCRGDVGDEQQTRFNRWHQIVTAGYISHLVH